MESFDHYLEEVINEASGGAKIAVEFPKIKDLGNIKSVRTFKGSGDFGAFRAAEDYAEKKKLEKGSMETDANPIGLADAEKVGYISKWTRMNADEQRSLDGVMVSKDFRNGDVHVVLFAR